MKKKHAYAYPLFILVKLIVPAFWAFNRACWNDISMFYCFVNKFSPTLIRSALSFLNAIKIFSAEIQYIKANIIPIPLKQKSYLCWWNKEKKNEVLKYPKIINETENLCFSNEASREPATIKRTPKTISKQNKTKKSIIFLKQTKTNWEKWQQIFFASVLNFQFEHWVPYVDWQMLMLP